MKVVIIISLLLTLFALFSPFVVLGRAQGLTEPEIVEDKAEAPAHKEEVMPYHSVIADTGNDVNVLMGLEPVVMDIEEYLVGVVAGEMPADFEPQALRAQAVAARTYTLHKMWVEPSANHDADVCTDASCCKAYLGENELRDLWGEDFDENIAKIELAVWETQGVYMVYDNEPVLAVFHSSSAGATENSGNVWNRDVPYLVSVQSPENGEEVTNFVTTVEFSYEEFEDIFLQNYPDAYFSEDTSQWVTDIVYSDSGRINSVTVGDIEILGTQLRNIYSLRSTAVSVAMGAKGVVFTVTGYGHGVGMSQYGANCLAKEGKTWREILQWYYTGIEFDTLLDSI